MQTGGLRTRGITKASTPEKPLITVVTVVYNGEATLEQTIQSVVNQTYDNVEYIIIDGASTDRTLDIIKKYEDKIDYWQSEPDKGIYDAMNKGIGLATGDWINFMNAGDSFVSDNVISKIYSEYNISKHDIIYGQVLNAAGTYVKQYPLSYLNLLFERMICHQAIFAKKNLFNGNSFDTNYKLIADRVWLYTCLKKGAKTSRTDLPIVKYDCTGVSQNYDAVSKESLVFQNQQFGKIGIFFFYVKRILRKIKNFF